MTPSQRNLVAAMLFLSVTVTGCPYLGWIDEPYGTVNVAVTMVAPWDEYATGLAASFPLTPQEALTKVIPRTGILEEKLIDALGFTARVGLPQSSESLTRTTTVTDEDTTTKQERIEKKEPGQIPQAGKAPGSDKAIKDLAGVGDSDRRLSKDPILEYTAATALYQEVQLLNRYVTDAALRHKMKPYIVRLQIGSVPFKRDQGYDLYAKIGFFPKDENRNTHSSFVLPLLVTDNLEGMLSSRTKDVIRQLSLAVTFMKAGIGGAAGVDYLKDDYRNEVFSEMNSLFTVGRVTNNAIAVRFGAVREGRERYATIPRTHNVTLVLMVPADFVAKNDEKREVRVVARTTARLADTGQELRHQGRYDRQDAVADVIEEFFLDKKEFDRKKQCTDPDYKEMKIPCTQALLESVWMNDFTGFHDYLINDKESGWYGHIGRFERDLWMDIVNSLDKSHYAGVRFQLPNGHKILLPEKQTIFLVDDGKTTTQATLLGGVGLNAGSFGAKLDLKLEDGTVIPIAGTLTPGPKGSNATLTFPSLAAWKIGKMSLDGTTLTGAKVTVSQDPGSARWDEMDPKIPPEHYNTVKYQKSSDPEKPAFTMRKTIDLLAPGPNNESSAKIYIEFAKNGSKSLAESVEVSVDGGILKTAVFSVGATSESLVDNLGKVMITKDGALELTLGNLNKSKKVTIKAVAKSGGKPVGADQPPIELEVVK